MKKASLLLFLAAVWSIPASADILSVTSPGVVNKGSTFDVTLSISDIGSGRPGDLLIGFGFNIGFDASELQLLSAAADSSNWFDVSFLPDQVLGLSFTGFPSGTPGPVTLASLTFQALAPGAAAISLTSDPNDLNTGLVYLNLPYGDIFASTTVVVTPEPNGLWLLGSIFALLAGWRGVRRLA